MNKEHFHTALHEGYPEIKPKSLNQYSTVINAFCKKRNITSDEELADIEEKFKKPVSKTGRTLKDLIEKVKTQKDLTLLKINNIIII